jgi:hypothetical protein
MKGYALSVVLVSLFFDFLRSLSYEMSKMWKHPLCKSRIQPQQVPLQMQNLQISIYPNRRQTGTNVFCPLLLCHGLSMRVIGCMLKVQSSTVCIG